MFGLYAPFGKKADAAIVCEMWHDEWTLAPMFSSLEAFQRLTSEPDHHPTVPDLIADPASPMALFEAAKAANGAGKVEQAETLLLRATRKLPEYTDCQALLATVYQRLGKPDDAARAAIQAIVSPPCFGARPIKTLRWLQNRSDCPADLKDDPIWHARSKLRLSYGGTKQNDDYGVMTEAIAVYLAAGRILRAVTLMQTYAELMHRETTAFQERYGFDCRALLEQQRELQAAF